MDPLALSLLSIFGGASLTVIGGLIGAWVQGRREHTKWVRERRFDAYVKVMTLRRQLQSASIAASLIDEDASDNYRAQVQNEFLTVAQSMPSAVGPLAILGPGDVTTAVQELLDSAPTASAVALEQATAVLEDRMRRALRIR